MNRCKNCMSVITKGNVCRVCNYDNNISAPVKSIHLTPGTVLKNRFVIGLSKKYNSIFTTYIAYDLKKNTKIHIDEFLPKDMAKRIKRQKDVYVEKGEKLKKFKKAKKIILNDVKTIFNEDIKNLDITGAFEDNNTVYIIRKLFRDNTLDEYIKNTENIDIDYASHIAVEIIKIINPLHKLGIICGNIEPKNIVIDPIGCVKIVNFQFFGSLSEILPLPLNEGYSSIEEYMPYTRLTEKSDVYSIAAVYYAVVTKENPVDAKSRRYSDTLVPPSTNGIKIRKNIENAIFNALNINPKNRTADLDTFYEEIINKNTQRRWERVKGKYKKDYSFIMESSFWIRITIYAIIIIMVVSLIGVIMESNNVRNSVEQNSKIRVTEISTMAVPQATEKQD